MATNSEFIELSVLRTKIASPGGAAERSESKIPMLAGGKHTAIK